MWRRRAEQVARDPASAAWVTGFIWDQRRRLAVGWAGCRSPPDEAGMVEIGHAVEPAHRRRGCAGAALEVLLDRAAVEPGGRTVRLGISPDNVISTHLATRFRFARVGGAVGRRGRPGDPLRAARQFHRVVLTPAEAATARRGVSARRG